MFEAVRDGLLLPDVGWEPPDRIFEPARMLTLLIVELMPNVV